MKTMFLLCSLFIWFVSPSIICAEETDSVKAAIELDLQQIFDKRTKLLITHDPDLIKPFYLPQEKASQAAMAHENNRWKYIKKWSEIRQVTFTNAEGKIRIARIRVSGDSAKVSLVHSLALTYTINNSLLPAQTFGVGTRHGITLKKVNDHWLVQREWYSDPLDENPDFIPVTIKAPNLNSLPSQEIHHDKKIHYHRARAVAYADKYAGAAHMAGNSNRYNKKYIDYTYEGGDCTNFASQVIGDPTEGGGLPMRNGWRYKNGGTVSWIRTDAFKAFLLKSGYATVIARGSFEQVMKPTEKFPRSAMAELKPGDLIAYEMHGDIDHFSIVTAHDPNGYVLVNSHTADRYHVPWDLGWDNKTKFWLIKIRD